MLCTRPLRAVRTIASNPISTLSARSLSHSSRVYSAADNSSNPLKSELDAKNNNTNHEPTTSDPKPTDSQNDTTTPPTSKDAPPPPGTEEEQGPMTRRLAQATEDALLTGGRAGLRAIEEAGFDENLRDRLLAKVASAKFASEHASALSEAGITSSGHSRIPGSAGQGTRSIASSQAWTGEESTEDAVLRMLNDAHKPLGRETRGKPKIPSPVVDMRIKRQPQMSAGRRVASAREKAQAYVDMELPKAESMGLTEEEREELRREFRERFTPVARAMPNTVSGLAALANERIENAIARGQFKNIPRGKGVERDTRADNPFIDTTEYIMNKMIKRQEIVPPWIEKQQELIKTAESFRKRLRNDWLRHAARMISSRGGTLEDQIRRASEYARAEEIHNPRRRNVDQISVPTNSTEDPVMVKIRQQTPDVSATSESTSQEPAVAATAAAAVETPTPKTQEPEISFTKPFRDPSWEAAERSFLELSITNLNAITRSYNLMAPELAKKPYFNLDRELNNCFADVAPLIAQTIKERATRPAGGNIADAMAYKKPDGILGRFTGEGKGQRVYERKEPQYGFREFWRDLWRKDK
ncbi:hypothetical protein NEUTE1DRAFT_122796 [Neurospora tetrasperma FGSC 2508]|uniref:DnaJ homologue subfamily C member 28 conserved domain-containing protein n=1 Tax=Neurospora tetrasperma (strain FGSC 2508 / ATCC MYA-4615 / P0657) TaxID=510951 RepID=F8MNZ2_NEUT8|nr:uncharacterized protein NEUTE1DRAFT_122796 [Neurospora tetrasperma FGSC 2508]EGO56211.1 hypothetical protein NEUTE1DRAFT_122796 [Neurospora tetrasperma FGSC 2508]EGZ70933.1 hypothetical protein NEUTE2DRAFT_114155 [Neurospora tetrasperma FGSC 2509]